MNTMMRTALILLSGCSALASAAEVEKTDLAAALTEFQLPESARTAKQLIPAWQPPRNIVVVVDKPERTAWLQQAMPAGVTVTGVRRDAEAQALLGEADAVVEVNCAIAVEAKAPKLRWLHGN